MLGINSYTSRVALFFKTWASTVQCKHGGRITPFEGALKDLLKDVE